MDHVLVAGFLVYHWLLNGFFLGSLKKGAHKEKIGLCLWAARFYLQLAYGALAAFSITHAREISLRSRPVISITWAGALFLQGSRPALIPRSNSSWR